VTGLADVNGVTSVTLGSGGTFNAGTLTFNSGGAVVISEDSGTDIVGVNTALSLDLDSTGAITDAAGATISVTNLADFNGGSVTLGDNGGDTTNFGTLTFNSAGAVNISEDSATAFAGTSTGTTITVNSAGAMTDAETDGTDEITGTSLVLTAVGGVGTGSGNNAIQIAVANLDVSNTVGGSIFATDTAGGLILTDLGGPNGNSVNGVGGGGEISAGSPLTISSDAITTGGMTYTASDSAVAGDDLTVQTGVTVQDTTGALVLDGGDQVLIQGTATVDAATSLTINVDPSAGDPDTTGGTVTIDNAATINTTTGTSISGGDDSDTFNFQPRATTSFAVDGNDPTAGTSPGDTLNLDLTGITTPAMSLVPSGTGAFASMTFGGGVLGVTFQEIETFDLAGGGPLDLTVAVDQSTVGNVGAGFFAANGVADSVELSLNATGQLPLDVGPTGTEVTQLIFNNAVTEINSITITGSADDDTLEIDDTAGGGLPRFAGTVPGLVNDDTNNQSIAGGASILFNAGAHVTGDAITYNLTQGGITTSQTYAVGEGDGGGSGTGTSEGEILTSNTAAEQNIVYFTGLEPITTSGVPGGTLTVLGDTNANTIDILDSPVAGNTRIAATNPVFETFDFAANAFAALEIYGMGAADIIDLQSFDALETSLATVRLDGDSNAGGDNSTDTLRVRSTTNLPITSRVDMYGGEGSDTFVLDSTPADSETTGTVDGIGVPVVVSPATDETTNSPADTLTVVDTDDTAPADNVIVTNNTINGITGLGAAGTDITYGDGTTGDQVETITIWTSNTTGDEVDVVSTLLNSVYNVNTQAGADTINVFSDADTQAAPGVTAVLDNIDGQLNINSGTEADTLNISDFGDTDADNYKFVLNGTINEIYFNDGDYDDGAGVAGDDPDIRYNVNAADQLETLQMWGGTGDDVFSNDDAVGPFVPATPPVAGSRIQANMFATSSNIFNGNDGDDTFTFEWDDGFSLAGMTTFQINGDDPASTTANRDVVNLRSDADTGGGRTMTSRYVAAGSVDVGGLGGAAGVVDASVVDVNTVEQLNYLGDGNNDDTLTAYGLAAGNNTLSVTPLTANSANVFLDGTPNLVPPGDTPTNNDPGVEGGSSGPDINIDGLVQTGFTMDGGAGTENRLVVNAPTEDVNGAGGGVGWAGNGFGSGSVVSVAGTDISWDDITVTDSLVSIDRDPTPGGTNLLLDVNVTTATFGRTAATEAELTVNTGEEQNVGTDGVADDVTVTLSTDFRFQINGGEPPLPGAPPLAGDRLNVAALPGGNMNIFSDLTDPPNVSITSTVPATGTSSEELVYNNIEIVNIRPDDATEEVNIIGDNNGANLDQVDEFIILGGDVDSTITDPGIAYPPDADGQNEFSLLINGSNPIGVYNTGFLNISGQGGNDSITIEPYADDTVGGWDIDVRIDGDGTLGGITAGTSDHIFYGNVERDTTNQPGVVFTDSTPDGSVSGVSEETVLAPSTTGGEGQIRATNAADGSDVVTADFVNVEDVSFFFNDGAAGDTDSLTILGTGEDDTVTADFTNDGLTLTPGSADAGLVLSANELIDIDQGATLLVQVHAAARAVPGATGTTPTLAALPAISFEPGDGDDTLTFTGQPTAATANSASAAAPTTINVDGGTPSASDNITLTGTNNANDTYVLSAGASADEGTIEVTLDASPTTTINFVNTEEVDIDGGGGTGTDTFTVNGTDGGDTFVLDADGVLDGTLEISFGPSVEFDDFGDTSSDVTLNGEGGDDSYTVIADVADWGLDDVTLDGGAPSASDSVSITGVDNVVDQFDFTASSANDGQVDVTNDGGTTFVNYILTDIESVSVDGQEGAGNPTDVLNAMNAPSTITPSSAEAGNVQPFDSAGAALLALVYSNIEDANTVAGALTVQGTEGDDTIVVSAAGIVTVNGTDFDASAATSLVINSGGGDDAITLNSDGAATLFAGGITVVGGDNGDGSDSLTINGDNANAGAEVIGVALSTGQVTGIVGGTISLTGIEHLTVDAQGQAGGTDTINVTEVGATSSLQTVTLANGETLTATGTAGDDTINVQPTAAGAGVLQATSGDPAVTYSGATTGFTVNGGSGGFDVLGILGDEGVDTVTTPTATTVTLNGTVTLGANLDRLDISTGGGNDSITLSNGMTIPKTIDAGDGDDTIDASAAAATDPTIYGGIGNDTITGSPGVDLIFGGAGNDTISGLAGADTIYGEDGDDNITGGTDADSLFGGDGSDTFVWAVGDGSDAVEGDSGDDVLQFSGDAAANANLAVSAAGDKVTVTDGAGTVTTGDVEQLDVNGLGGADTVVVNDLSGTSVSLVNVDVAAGDAGDAVTIHGTGGDDSAGLSEAGGVVAVTGLAAEVRVTNAEAADTVTFDGDEGSDSLSVTSTAVTVTVDTSANTVAGVATPTIGYADLENLHVTDGGTTTNLAVSGSTSYTVNAGAATDEGQILTGTLSITFDGLGSAENLQLNGTGEITVNGTDANDSILVVAGGDVQFAGRATVQRTGTTTDLTINGLDGDDTLAINNGHPYTRVNLRGGNPSASDTAIIAGDATNALTATIGIDTPMVTGGGLNTVTLTGIEIATVTNGGAAINIAGSTNPDTIRVTPTGTNSATIRADNFPLTLNTNNSGTLTVDEPNGGDDEVTVVGTGNGEVIAVARAAATTVTVGALKAVAITAANVETANVDGGSGNDIINVTGTGGPTNLFVQGGADSGIDLLSVTMATAGSTLVSAGATDDAGLVVTSGDGTTRFAGIEGVTVTGAAATDDLTVLGTNADDAIRLARWGGLDAVRVNNRAPVTFATFDQVTLHGQSGDDAISVAPDTLAAGLTSIIATGGSPSASDTLSVDGTTGTETIAVDFDVTATTGTVTVGALPGVVTFDNTVESLFVDGLGGNDTLTVVDDPGGTNNDVFTLVPGAASDAGTLQVNDRTALGFEGLGATGGVTLSGGAGGTDVINYQGTDVNDAFTVATGTGAVDLVSGTVDHVDVTPTSIETLALNGLAGDDTFTVAGGHGYTTVNLGGGDPSASDVANVNGDGTAGVVVTLGIVPPSAIDATVTGGGVGTVNLAGVEHANVSNTGATDTITVQGEDDNDTLVVTPSVVTNTAVIQANGLSPVVAATTADTLTVAGGAGGAADELLYSGTSVSDAITIGATTIAHTGFKTITYDGTTEVLRVDGGLGDDTIDASAATATWYIGGGGGDDTLTGGSADDQILGGTGTDIISGGAGADTIDGEAGDDVITGGDGNDNLRGGDGVDVFQWADGDDDDILVGGTGGDLAIFNGSAAAEVFTLQSIFAEQAQLTRDVGGGLRTSGVESFSIDGGAGADDFVVHDLERTDVGFVEMNLGLGDAAADDVTVHGRTVADDLMITASGIVVSVTGLGYDVNVTNPVAGDDELTVSGNDGDDVIKAAAGVEGSIQITLNGDAGDDYLSADATLNGGAGNDTLIGGAGADTLNGGDGDDILDGRGDNDTINGDGGTDTILVSGTAAGETISVNHSAAATLALSGGLSGGTETIGTVEAVRVEAGDGDDTIQITALAAGGLDYTALGGNPAGAVGDTIQITTPANVTVTAGPENDAGSIELATTAVTNISYDEIEDLSVTANPAGAAVTVSGTNADNDITLIGDAADTNDFTVSVDGGPAIQYVDFGSVQIDGLAGDDDVDADLNALDVTVIVNGGDSTGDSPSASGDIVTITGRAGGADGANYTPQDVDGGQFAFTGLTTAIDLNQVEGLIYDGVNENETLTVTGQADDDTIVHTPGASVDAGSVQVDNMLPIQYVSLGVTGSVSVDGGGQVTADALQYVGTQLDDQFDVAATTGTIDLQTTSIVATGNRVDVLQTGVERLILNGLGGDDSFNVNAPHPYSLLMAHGGGPGNSDLLTITGATGTDETVDVIPGAIAGEGGVTGFGTGPVNYVGVEDVHLFGNTVGGDNDDITIHDDTSDNVWTVDNGTLLSGTRVQIDDREKIEFTGFNDATLQNGPVAPTGIDTFRVHLFTAPLGLNGTFTVTGTGSDTLEVIGTSENDTMSVEPGAAPPQGTARIAGNALDFNGIRRVTLAGLDGNDTFRVEPDSVVATAGGYYVKVDGGSPLASDALVIADVTGGLAANLAATDFVVVGHSRVPDAGNVLTFRSTTRLPDIAYENVEVVAPLVAAVDADTGDPNLLILGPDMYEQNEYRATAAYLGSGDALNVQNLAIFPNSSEHPDVPADVDYFRVVAETTGVLDFTIYFHDLNGLVTGDGNLDIRVLDSDGSVIAGTGTFGNQDGTEDARIRIPAVAGQTYYLHVAGDVADVVNGYDLTVDNYAPPTPFDLELEDAPVGDDTLNDIPSNSDTGRSQFDNNTRDNTPTLLFRLDDGIFLYDLPGNNAADTPADEVIAIPFQAGPAPAAAGYAIAIFDEGVTDPAAGSGTGLVQTPLGFATQLEDGLYTFTTPALDDGSHFLTARVQMLDPASPQQTGWGARSDSLEIVVDTAEPPVSFGDTATVNDGLHPDSDTGVDGGSGNQSTLEDRITSDETPSFWGRAEADAFIRVYVDTDLSNTVTVGDVLIGETTAIVEDGSDQFPNGRWELTSTINMNDPDLLTALGAANIDGLRRILVTAEDIPGNVNDVTGAAEVQQILGIFVDTQGPQIFDPDGAATARHAVEIVGNESFDLFDHKDNPNGALSPTPLVSSLRINVQDLPNRDALFLYNTLQENTNGDPAEDPGNFLLVGDANGVIPIQTIAFNATALVAGSPAEGEIILTFATPLPDDRFTLTVSDDVVDPAGNGLDGETNATEPQEPPTFPTGDGQAGGDFVARFTVDSRPELGLYHSGSVWVDTNGNFDYDPDNQDYTNRDITYMMAVTTDDVFAGNFAGPGADGTFNTADDPAADGFDKLAAYGRIGSSFRWLIDFDNDGVPEDIDGDGVVGHVDDLGVNGLPVAGNFDGNATNGDEIGYVAGSTWYVDTDHTYTITAADTVFNSSLTGLPIVGDFNGDGWDDLGTWRDDQFTFQLATAPATWSATVLTLEFGFIGVREMPVAADFDQDGIDDVGLWVPDRAGVNPENAGEWYILVTGGETIPARIVAENGVAQFEPVPFGYDMHAVFGDEFGVPVVGNFDPPTTPVNADAWSVGNTNPDNAYDVNGDGYVSPLDVLTVINQINRDGSGPLGNLPSAAGPYVDAHRDGVLSPMDVLTLINVINAQVAGGGEGEQASVVEDIASVDEVVTGADPVDQLLTVEFVSLPTDDSLATSGDGRSIQNVDSYFTTHGQRDQASARDTALFEDDILDAVLDDRSAHEESLPSELDAALDLEFALSDIAADVSLAMEDDEEEPAVLTLVSD